MNFWKKLKNKKGPASRLGGPILALAPMADVTDAAFRRIIAKYGKFTRPDGSIGGGPDVMFTEFVSCDGLCSSGRKNLLPILKYSERERPIVAQVFGAKPENFYESAKIIKKLGFDGIDINMGCPDKDIEKSGGGAALIKNPKLAQEIIRATKRGAPSLPVSVKTRIGYSGNEIKEWLPALLQEDLAALTVHLRTRNEMSDVPAHWELARDILAMRNEYAPGTILLGNGDVSNLTEAKEKIKESGFDGVMLGRGIFGNPWLFSGRIPSLKERLEVMIEHTELFEKIFKSGEDKENGGLKNFDVMKKHFKAYVTGFDGAKDLRVMLMGTKNASEVRYITETFLKNKQ